MKVSRQGIFTPMTSTPSSISFFTFTVSPSTSASRP